MPGLEKATIRREITRTPINRLTDAWISHTITGAFGTEGMKAPAPVPTVSRINTPEDSNVRVHTQLPDALIDGKDITVFSFEPKKSVYKSILTIAKDKRDRFETNTQPPEAHEFNEFAEMMEQNIEFAVAALKLQNKGHFVHSAIGIMARNYLNAYEQAGIIPEMALKRVAESIDFATDVFNLHKKLSTN